MRNLLKARDGQVLVEYGLIMFFIALMVIASLLLLGPSMGSVFSGISGSIRV